MASDEIDRFVGEPVGQVNALRNIDRRLCLEVEVSAHAHNGLVESALARVIIALLAEVPFAEQAAARPLPRCPDAARSSPRSLDTAVASSVPGGWRTNR